MKCGRMRKSQAQPLAQTKTKLRDCERSRYEHKRALRGTSRGGFAGVPNALNLELYLSVFSKSLSL